MLSRLSRVFAFVPPAAEEIVPSLAIVILVPAVSAATTLAVSVTSALASMPSSFVPSVATSRPSTVPLTNRLLTDKFALAYPVAQFAPM